MDRLARIARLAWDRDVADLLGYWVLVTTLGAGVQSGVSTAMQGISAQYPWPNLISPVAQIISIAPIVFYPLAEWLVLRQYIEVSARRWVLFTVGGPFVAAVLFMLAFLIVFVVHILTNPPGVAFDTGRFVQNTAPLVWICIGIFQGWAQWLALRWMVPRAGWLIAANLVAAAILTALYYFSADPAVGPWTQRFESPSLALSVLDGLARGAVYGVITGVVLVWLLREALTSISDIENGMQPLVVAESADEAKDQGIVA